MNILDTETKNIIKSFKADIKNDTNLRDFAICRYFISGEVADVGFVDIYDNSPSGFATTTFRDIIVKGNKAESFISRTQGGTFRVEEYGRYREEGNATFCCDIVSGSEFKNCDEVWLGHDFNVDPPTSGNCGDIKYKEADNFSSGEIDGGRCYKVMRNEDLPLGFDTIAHLKLKEDE